MSDPLSYDRIRDARETLTAAAVCVWREGFRGAIEAADPDGSFIEAKRNLTALVHVKHGVDAFERMLDEDAMPPAASPSA